MKGRLIIIRDQLLRLGHIGFSGAKGMSTLCFGAGMASASATSRERVSCTSYRNTY